MSCWDPPAPWSEPPAGRAQPGLVTLRDWLLDRFPGSVSLGIYGDRPVSGGNTPSVHRDGRALDWAPADDGQREEAWDLLTGLVGRLLQVQLVLDYRGNRGCRPTCQTTFPWPRSGHWLHLERRWAGALDPRPIGMIIAEHEEEVMDMVALAPGMPGPDGRWPFVKLSQSADGRWWLLAMNGARLANAAPTPIFGISGVPLPYPLVGRPSGVQVVDGTAVVMAADGGTFAYPFAQP